MAFNDKDILICWNLPNVDEEAGWADKIQETACSARMATHFQKKHLRVVKVCAGIIVGAVHPVWWVSYQK